MYYSIFKKLWSILLVLTFAVGIVLIYVGKLHEDIVMERSGIAVLFGGIFLLLLAAVLAQSIVSYKKAKDAGKQENPRDFNINDRADAANYLFGGSFLSGKIKQTNVVVIGAVLQTVLLCCLFGGFALLFAHLYPAAVVCLCVFGVTIFTLMLTAIVCFLCDLTKKRNTDETENQQKKE